MLEEFSGAEDSSEFEEDSSVEDVSTSDEVASFTKFYNFSSKLHEPSVDASIVQAHNKERIL